MCVQLFAMRPLIRCRRAEGDGVRLAGDSMGGVKVRRGVGEWIGGGDGDGEGVGAGDGARARCIARAMEGVRGGGGIADGAGGRLERWGGRWGGGGGG